MSVRRRFGWTLGLLWALCGCAGPPAEDSESREAYLPLEVKPMPKPLPGATLMDFGGRLHLIGYEIEASEPLQAGAPLSVTLYLRAVGDLSPGFRPVVGLLDGARVTEAPGPSPFQTALSALGLGQQELGRVYADRQAIQVPAEIDSAELALVVYVEADQAGPTGGGSEVRLPVLGGSQDLRERGILQHLSAVPHRAQKAKRAKRSRAQRADKKDRRKKKAKAKAKANQGKQGRDERRAEP